MQVPPPRRDLNLHLKLSAEHPALLAGLDHWLQLGLISDAEVRSLCQRSLICPRREIAVPQSPEARPVAVPAPSIIQVPTAEDLQTTQALPPSIFQRFISEVSVLWLLFLGVFLVVVSSGVLAATQWRYVPPTGQYSILWGYTLAFWGASHWTQQKPQLQLTAWMLQMTCLLIIPVNFWMMDGFQLLQLPLGIGLAIVAALVLSGIMLGMLRQEVQGWRLVIPIVLSWLHWGWGWTGVPILAVYLGCGLSGIAGLQQPLTDQTSAAAPARGGWQSYRFNILLTYGALLLLFRAGLVAAVPLSQMGLALGLTGSLLCWQGRQAAARWAVGWLGILLMVCGWLVSVESQPPWQAFIISGLGMGLLGDGLSRRLRAADLTGFWLMGLSTLWLAIRLIPSGVREGLLQIMQTWVGAQGLPAALWGLLLQGFIWGMLGLCYRLRLFSTPVFVRTTGLLTGGLGLVSIGLSLGNPALRSLTLWLLMLPLLVGLWRSPHQVKLAYGCQIVGLGAIASTLDTFWPVQTLHGWGLAALVLMLLEWLGIPFLGHYRAVQQSNWVMGLVLAGLGYTILAQSPTALPQYWGSLTLLMPLALTRLSLSAAVPWTKTATVLSIVSLCLLPPLVQPLALLELTPRLLWLGGGTLLMMVNSYRLPHVGTAALTLGFGLCFSATVLWEWVPDATLATWLWWVVGWLWLLFGLRQVWCWPPDQTASPRPTAYALAIDGWAIALMAVASLTAVCHAVLVTSGFDQWLTAHSGQYPAAMALMLGAIGYRYWQTQRPVWLLGVTWLAEATLISGLTWLDQPFTGMAIASIALGYLTYGLRIWGGDRLSSPDASVWQVMPLSTSWLALPFAHSQWAATTGLYTLAIACLQILVGRRRPSWQPVTILGLLGVSFSLYELLLYPLSQQTGGPFGDALVALGGLSLSIALVALGCERWSSGWLRVAPGTPALLGHIHWGCGSLLMLGANLAGVSSPGFWFSIVTLGGLGSYALWQGRQNFAWVYLGLAQLLITLSQICLEYLPNRSLLHWSGAIAAAIAFGLYCLPWGRWGWSMTPFRQVAVALPLGVAGLTLGQINTTSLLLVAAVYGWFALVRQTPRLSYVGLVFAGWGALRILADLRLISPVWQVTVLGLGLFYVAQVDPELRSPSRRDLRHWLRCFAVGLISVTVLYEFDTGFIPGLVTLGISLGLIALGLALRLRALLYVGTLSFIFKVLRMIWLFVANESLVLWAFGIALGLLLIWIAATFESRRSQVTALLDFWSTKLEQWD